MLRQRRAVLIATLTLGSMLLTVVHAAYGQMPSAGARLDGAVNPPPGAAAPLSSGNMAALPEQSAVPDMAPSSSTPSQSGATVPPPSGTVLASDTFSVPAGGLFTSGSDASFTWGYISGEYQIASLEPLLAQGHLESAQGDYTDLTVTVDAHFGPNPDAFGALGAGCRITGDSAPHSGYVFRFYPAFGYWNLLRIDSGKTVPLAQDRLDAPPFLTASHHLILTCQGTTVTASIDRHELASTQDAGYSHGRAALYAFSGTTGAAGAYQSRVDVRFNNLVVTQP